VSSPQVDRRPARRQYIDWLRGIAVLVMIEWHSVDAWTADPERSRPVFGLLAYIGGWAAPLFLFLAGVAVPLAATAYARRGQSCRDASWTLQKRGWQIFLVAHLFRLQSFIFNPWARVDSIFKPDILNILGLGLVATAWCWGRSDVQRRRLAWLLAPAAAIVLLTPWSREWWWPTLLHLRLEAYIRPNGGWGVFTIFPWLAYVLVGAAVGMWIAKPRPQDQDARFHLRLALVAALAVAVGLAGPYLPSALSPAQGVASWPYFVGRTGLMVLALCLAWLLVEWPQASVTERLWGPVVLFGRTSLFVYWVHVELAYGVFSAAWKRSLTIEEWAAAYMAFTVMLYGMAILWARRPRGPLVPGHMRA